MAFEELTFSVTDTCFAPTGAQVVWDINNTSPKSQITTYIVSKNQECGAITIIYDPADLPAGIESLTPCHLSNPKVTNPCGIIDLLRGCFVNVTAGNAVDDVSGGEAQLKLCETIHIWSESLNVTVDSDGRVNIETIE